MMKDNTYLLIGLCKKANRLISGEQRCENTIKKEETKLLIIAEDSSNNTQKKFINMCMYRDTNYKIWGTKERIGNAIGSMNIAVISINDIGFANKLIEIMNK